MTTRTRGLLPGVSTGLLSQDDDGTTGFHTKPPDPFRLHITGITPASGQITGGSEPSDRSPGATLTRWSMPHAAANG